MEKNMSTMTVTKRVRAHYDFGAQLLALTTTTTTPVEKKIPRKSYKILKPGRQVWETTADTYYEQGYEPYIFRSKLVEEVKPEVEVVEEFETRIDEVAEKQTETTAKSMRLTGDLTFIREAGRRFGCADTGALGYIDASEATVVEDFDPSTYRKVEFKDGTWRAADHPGEDQTFWIDPRGDLVEVVIQGSKIFGK